MVFKCLIYIYKDDLKMGEIFVKVVLNLSYAFFFFVFNLVRVSFKYLFVGRFIFFFFSC